jgi:Zn-dependent protease with chaperone function
MASVLVINPLKKALFLFSLLVCCLSGSAQLKPIYVFQQDDTLARKKYYDQATQKKDKLINGLPKEYSKEYIKDYKKIYENRHEQVGGLLKSTRCVTEPEANAYLQSLVQKIVAVNPELKGLDMRVIFARDWWPNAYSMGEGTIAVNAGLMVFMDNEAELIFVLCHELSHYYLDHSQQVIKNYVERTNSAEFKAEVKRLSKEEYRVSQQIQSFIRSIEFNNRRHSRDKESEADRQAFRFMKNTGYDLNAITTCLQMLDKVDDTLIYGSLNLQPLLDFPGYPFRKKWIQKESAIFAQVKESDSPLTKQEKDSLKTHPSCTDRIQRLEDSINALAASGRKKFIVNETLFNKLKKDFLIEMIEQTYKEDNVSINLYYSLLLLQANEQVPLAVYSIARDLNLIYEAQKNHMLGKIIAREDRIFPDDYNLLLRMLNKLQLAEIGNLNYHFCTKYESTMKGYAGFEKELQKAKTYRN